MDNKFGAINNVVEIMITTVKTATTTLLEIKTNKNLIKDLTTILTTEIKVLKDQVNLSSKSSTGRIHRQDKTIKSHKCAIVTITNNSLNNNKEIYLLKIIIIMEISSKGSFMMTVTQIMAIIG